MPMPAPDHIIARLLLRAVLPALPLYVERDESARRTIEGWRVAVRFASAGGVATTLSVRNGAVAVDEPRPGFALRLFFLSDRDLIRAFRREGLPWVLPWGGLHHLARLPALSSLLADMAEVLNTPTTETPESGPGWRASSQSGKELRAISHEYTVDHRHSRASRSGRQTDLRSHNEHGEVSRGCAFDPRHSRESGNPRTTRERGSFHASDRRELRVALLLGALLPAAVTELGTHDEECRRLLVPFGDFAAQWSVPRVVDGWITQCGGRMVWGRGDPPVAPDVRIEFQDSEVALSAVDGMLDSLAASVTGEIAVRGMIPLADALAQVMERVSECLGQSHS